MQMVKRPDYSDLVGIKTPRQKKQEAQVTIILSDINKIDNNLGNESFEELKLLHIELDGKYQNLIKNWGSGMYNYVPQFGFNYEYIDIETLKQNMYLMKNKLRGLLLEIEPTADDYIFSMRKKVEDEIVKKNFDNKKVFIVHGHDTGLLNEVELLLRRVGLEPIILKNEANAGRTIIEKIEELTDVGFGIVLYTGCDEGRKKGDKELKDRARQNVIFEHGYLCAKLGRGRVVALNDDGIEVPSDLSGVLYVPRSEDNWTNMIMREIKSAGLEFDPTRA